MSEATQGRREFLKASTAAAAGTALAGAIATRAYAGGDDVLRVGMIGCGGRGSGAARQALNADKNVKLVALADAFSDRLEAGLKNLKKSEVGSKVEARGLIYRDDRETLLTVATLRTLGPCQN